VPHFLLSSNTSVTNEMSAEDTTASNNATDTGVASVSGAASSSNVSSESNSTVGAELDGTVGAMEARSYRQVRRIITTGKR
jgi:hypothetical protein